MKTNHFIIFFLILFNFSFAQKHVKYIYPQTKFNKNYTAKLLDNAGKSSIKGIALLKGKPVSYFMKVALYPLTEYFEEYLALEKKIANNGKKRASISPEALSYRIITKVNGHDGSFEFTNLRQGKYYIEGYLNVVKEKKSAYFVGQNSTTFEGSYMAGSSIFQEFNYNKSNGYFISGISEILNEGDTISIIIKN